MTLTLAEFAQKLSKTRRPVKLALLDSSLVAGLGNIYVCDALNLAKISPFRASNTLANEEMQRLLVAAQTVIERGIALKGTTFDGKYVDIAGFAGGYQTQALAYGRVGQSCYNCGAEIMKIQQNGRGTYYCAHCQK